MKLRNLTLAFGLLVSAGTANASIISLGDGPHGGAHEGDIQIGDLSQCVTVFHNPNLTLMGGAGYGTCTAIGRLAYNYYGGTSIGDQTSSWRGGVAIGFRSSAAENSVAISGAAQAGAVAILGTASVPGAVAIQGTVDALNSIAIGGHTRGRENIVTFGDANTGATRQIAGVAPGTELTDAVNLQQLRDAEFGGTNPHFAAQGDGTPNDGANAGATNTVAAGPRADVTEYGGTVVGADGKVHGDSGTGVGHQVLVETAGGTAMGAYSHTSARCTALGYASECNEDNTTSLGREGETSRLTNVSDGRDDTDAANMRQVNAVDLRVTQTQNVVSSQASYFGGGASYNPGTGIYTAPSFVLSMGTYGNVNDALLALDSRIGEIETGTGETGPQGPSGPTGQTGADGRSAYEVAVDEGFEGTRTEWLESLQGADGADGEDGVGGGSTVKPGANVEVTDNADGTQTVGVADNIQLSDQGSVQVGATTVNGSGVRIEGGPSMTTAGIDAGGQRVTSVAAGRIERGSTDAVNGGQIFALEDRWNDRWTETNNRFEATDKRIDGLGAQSAAMSQMSGAGLNLAVGEVDFQAAGGAYGSATAFAVGFRARVSERISVSIGASFGNGDTKPMGGIGISIRLGR